VIGGVIPKAKLRKGEAPAQSEATQVVALSHILNRAYGFPSQPLSHSADETFETLLDRLERRRLGQSEPAAVIELQSTTDGSFEFIDQTPRETHPQTPPRGRRRPAQSPNRHTGRLINDDDQKTARKARKVPQ
jgi:hypothetical protein